MTVHSKAPYALLTASRVHLTWSLLLLLVKTVRSDGVLLLHAPDMSCPERSAELHLL